MLANASIRFVNLGIEINKLPKNISIFGFKIAFYGCHRRQRDYGDIPPETLARSGDAEAVPEGCRTRQQGAQRARAVDAVTAAKSPGNGFSLVNPL